MEHTLYTLQNSAQEWERLEKQAIYLYGGLEYLIPYVGQAQSILDVGCGVGTACRFLAERFPAEQVKITGIDCDSQKIDEARQLTKPLEDDRLAFDAADVYELPFEDNSYDFIMCRFVLMHLEDPEKAIREIYRVLKPGGRVIFHEGFHASIKFFPKKWCWVNGSATCRNAVSIH